MSYLIRYNQCIVSLSDMLVLPYHICFKRCMSVLSGIVMCLWGVLWFLCHWYLDQMCHFFLACELCVVLFTGSSTFFSVMEHVIVTGDPHLTIIITPSI